jgi:leader peptidase (prepilin peptidase)/N-methyltransferase
MPRGQSMVRGVYVPALPADDSLVRQHSAFSWFVLGGKCRSCKWKIPFSHPLVGLTVASAAAAVWAQGTTLTALWVFAFLAIMIAITFITGSTRSSPIRFPSAAPSGMDHAAVCLDITLVQSMGSLVGAGLILGIALLYKAARKVDGMGGGDVKPWR